MLYSLQPFSSYLLQRLTSLLTEQVGCITRLVPQKGVHLIRHAIYRTIELGGQFVLLGSSPVHHIQVVSVMMGEKLFCTLVLCEKLWLLRHMKLKFVNTTRSISCEFPS